MGGFIAPALNYSILAPIITLLAGALIGVLVEAFAPREKRGSIQLPLTLLTLVDRKSTRLNSSHSQQSRMPSSA